MRYAFAFVAFSLLGGLALADDVSLSVRTKRGDVLKGTLEEASFKMKTAVGEVTVEWAKVTSIEFGPPDTVTLSDKTVLKGDAKIDSLKLVAAVGVIPLGRGDIKSIRVEGGPVAFVNGEIVDGAAANGVTYHVRLPEKYDPKVGRPAILILHGSNMNSKAYVGTIVSAWPGLAAD